MRWYTYGAQLNFNYLTFEQAFEYAILEYPFSFWQWGSDCSKIPSAEAKIEDVLYHFVSVSGIDFFSDKSMVAYASHYYQAGAQMGYYGYELGNLKDLITALPNDRNPSAVFMPNKLRANYNNNIPKKTNEWLKKNGNQFIYINGNTDTWSATAVRPTKGIDALWYFLPNKDHGKARIENMTNKEQEKMVEALERWLDLEIE